MREARNELSNSPRSYPARMVVGGCVNHSSSKAARRSGESRREINSFNMQSAWRPSVDVLQSDQERHVARTSVDNASVGSVETSQDYQWLAAVGECMNSQRFRIVTQRARATAATRVANLELEPVMEVVIKPYKKDRTLAQNSLMWMWFSIIRDALRDAGENYSKDDVHDFFVDEFLPTRAIKIRGETKVVQITTSRLKVKEFSEFLNNVDHHCGSEWGISLPHPDGVWQEAMGQRLRDVS